MLPQGGIGNPRFQCVICRIAPTGMVGGQGGGSRHTRKKTKRKSSAIQVAAVALLALKEKMSDVHLQERLPLLPPYQKTGIVRLQLQVVYMSWDLQFDREKTSEVMTMTASVVRSSPGGWGRGGIRKVTQGSTR